MFFLANTSTTGYAKSNESWLYQKKNPTILKSSSPVTSVKDFITDEYSLRRYIQDYEDYEKKAAISTNVQETSNSFSFWSPSYSSNLNEVSPILRRCTYQLSSLSTGFYTNSNILPKFLDQVYKKIFFICSPYQ